MVTKRVEATGWAVYFPKWAYLRPYAYRTRRELIEDWDENPGTRDWKTQRRVGHLRAVKVRIIAEVEDDAPPVAPKGEV